jgi:MoaA/NifB/PqqE/SkfB family radical SAM enzyme
MSANTWDCGHPKSASNVFSWKPEPVQPTAEQLEAQRKRELQREKDRTYDATHRRKRREHLERVNQNIFLGAYGGTANDLKTKTPISGN